MLSSLILVHRNRQGSDDLPFEQSFSQWAKFETCMRRMALSLGQSVPESRPHDEVYEGEHAYRFLLQVVCGLRSPVKGETEIQGQYRKFIDSFADGEALKNVLLQILRDSREVRTNFLSGLGSQSYGSFARRRLKDMSAIHLIGTGQLAEELFPWFAKATVPVFVYGRDAGKLEALKRRFPAFQMGLIGKDQPAGGALVIAASMATSALTNWLDVPSFETILDYRGESHADPLPAGPQIMNLKDIFQELEATRAKVNDSVEKAERYIQSLVEKKFVCS